MKIRYILHALERMKQRGIDKEVIKECFKHPDKDEKLNDIYRCVKRINSKVLVIIYRIRSNTILVITAFVSSKLHKYLF